MRTAFALLCVAAIAIAGTSAATTYNIKIDNLSRSQPLSRFVIATHTSSLAPIFEFNEPASSDIIAVAEDGDGMPLFNSLKNNRDVKFATLLDNPIPPGQSYEGTIEVKGSANYLSMASMAVNTNDCFVGLAGERIQLESQVFNLPGLDAGSEENNELCSSIPGPACPQGNVRSRNGEGRVFVHAGFFGINEGRTDLPDEDLSVRGTPLEASRYDWRNPMVRVTITEASTDDDSNAVAPAPTNTIPCSQVRRNRRGRPLPNQPPCPSECRTDDDCPEERCLATNGVRIPSSCVSESCVPEKDTLNRNTGRMVCAARF